MVAMSSFAACGVFTIWAFQTLYHQNNDGQTLSRDLEARLMYVKETPSDRWLSSALVKIQDARPRLNEGNLSLDENGVTLVQHSTALITTDFLTNADLVRSTYYSEICEAVQKATGAALVLAFHHRVRTVNRFPGASESDNDQEHGGKVYDERVHSDYTPRSAEAVRKWQLQNLSREEADVCNQGRFLLINAWRNIDDLQPVVKHHLAVCDGTSLELQDLIFDESRDQNVVFTAENFSEVVKGPTVRHAVSHRHQWLYFPHMVKSELLLFKCFDSDPSAPSRFAVHCAFDDPIAPRNAPSRSSIEVRTIAFLPQEKC